MSPLKLCVILPIALSMCTGFAFSENVTEAELKSIQKLVLNTEKQTKDKAIRSGLKRVRKRLDRVRELWKIGAVPNSLPYLMEVRRSFYQYGSSESQIVNQNLRLAMTRLWPFLLKSGRFKSDVYTSGGVRAIRLLMPEGTYRMTFPEDVKPGETISGRIEASPPKTASLYLLTIMGTPEVPDGNLRKWNLPETFELVLSDHWGNEIIRSKHKITLPPEPSTQMATDPNLQIEKQPREAKQNIEIPHLLFQISSSVEAGGHLIVKGPFDGDFHNTSIGVGKYEGHILTESPGKLVLAIHPQMIGDLTVQIREDGTRARCKIKVVTQEVDPFVSISSCIPPAN